MCMSNVQSLFGMANPMNADPFVMLRYRIEGSKLETEGCWLSRAKKGTGGPDGFNFGFFLGVFILILAVVKSRRGFYVVH
jgi:hypothetical protein